jgi:uncharacterized protein
MSERDSYPPGVPCWVETLQPDVDAALSFYAELFGWDFDGPGPMPGDSGGYFVARLRGRDVAGVGALPHDADVPTAWGTYVRVANADDATGAALRAGGRVLMPPFDAAPAGRAAVLADPAGAVFAVWEAGTREGAQVVNEPRAWAMSALRTDDPEGAMAFYGSALGWQPEPFGPLGSGALFRLPGYVGGQPMQPVPRDVVAVLVPSDGSPGALWNVDFWVDDADGTVATAERLGGKAIVPPYDANGFRSAVIADPQGAVFSVSKRTAIP